MKSLRGVLGLDISNEAHVRPKQGLNEGIWYPRPPPCTPKGPYDGTAEAVFCF